MEPRTAWPARIAGSVLLLLAATTPVAAGSFSIAPIRIELSSGHRIEVITVHNDEDAPVVVQVRTVAWTQDESGERYLDTHDLLTTPPVFQLAAKGEQIVRVALRRAVDAARELDYRVMFQEVPQSRTADFNGLNVALRISLPIFIKPAQTAHAEVVWQGRWRDDGLLQIDASNHGTAHLQIFDFELRCGDATEGARASASRYLLPGSSASWNLKPPPGIDHNAPLHVHGFSDQGEFSAAVSRTDS
jgi:fimbrial chaperone protein